MIGEMKKKIAIAGLRHGHVFDLIKRLHEHPETEIVAMAEPDAATRETLASNADVKITHDSVEKMFDDTEFDVLVVGDYYAIRGQHVIRALKAGKHAIADKPLCTSLEELEEIRTLSKEKGLKVGCQLDLRTNPNVITLRSVLQSGRIGDVVTISVSGQHPLLLGSRPAWYFEEGKHGGTINDIGIHFFDLVPWLTGRSFTEVVAAREWNAKAKATPHFQDCAQFFVKLDNNGSVLGDMSYLAPDGVGYKLPQYWRFVVHGTKGVAETGTNYDHVLIAADDDQEIEKLAPLAGNGGQYLRDFLADIDGSPNADGLTTEVVLRSSEVALKVQKAAGTGETGVSLA